MMSSGCALGDDVAAKNAGAGGRRRMDVWSAVRDGVLVVLDYDHGGCQGSRKRRSVSSKRAFVALVQAD